MLDQHIRAHLGRARGDNRMLANELCEKLSVESKRRLLDVLRDLEQKADSERSKRRRGQFWG
jgi:hypothetical protein